MTHRRLSAAAHRWVTARCREEYSPASGTLIVEVGSRAYDDGLISLRCDLEEHGEHDLHDMFMLDDSLNWPQAGEVDLWVSGSDEGLFGNATLAFANGRIIAFYVQPHHRIQAPDGLVTFAQERKRTRSRKRRVRWVCPQCDDSVLGSTRPRKDATVRYCLDCSVRTGYLVARESPTLQQRRQAKAEKRVAKARNRYLHEGTGIDVRAECKRLLQIARSEYRHERRYQLTMPKKLTLRTARKGRTSGHAYVHHSICLTLRTDATAATVRMLVAHELAHYIAPYHSNHGSVWREVYVRLVERGYGVLIDRTPCPAYDLDRRVEAALA